MGIGRLFQCLLANFVRLRQVLILALDFSSGPLTNFKGAFHKIPCGHSPLKVMIMSQKWPPQTLRTVSSNKNCLIAIIGLTLIIGLQKTFIFFARRQKWKGTAAFLGGITLILLRWPLTGFLVELYGIFVLFRDFFATIDSFAGNVLVV